MATTSLWHIKGHLRDLVDYVENPEKTYPELQDLWDASRYVQRPAATADGHYVSAINCLKETALEQMILTKRQYGKTDGYIAFHGYQSFKPGEVTAQECHDIGVALAKEMWGDRFQILVTTHLDKDHLHNLYLFNSVSFRDGRKYNYSKAEIQRLTLTNLSNETKKLKLFSYAEWCLWNAATDGENFQRNLSTGEVEIERVKELRSEGVKESRS